MRITGVPPKTFCPIDQQQIIIESYDVLAENIKSLVDRFSSSSSITSMPPPPSLHA
jgi:hypothetical protein